MLVLKGQLSQSFKRFILQYSMVVNKAEY